jgi:hypothetical protein
MATRQLVKDGVHQGGNTSIEDPISGSIIDEGTGETAKVDDNQALHNIDIRALDVLKQILITLKKIEIHMSIASDTELTDEDVREN